MKSTTILLTSLFILGLYSCKKQYDCNCNTKVVATNMGATTTRNFSSEKVVSETSKKKAEAACDDFKKGQEATYRDSVTTGGTPGTEVSVNTNCSLTKQ